MSGYSGAMLKPFAKIKSCLVLFLLTVIFPVPAHAGYWKNLGYDWTRGVKNMVSSPLEIPLTIKEHHDGPAYPVVSQVTGFFDGVFQGIARLGSGAWDFPAGLLPGVQEGLPVVPETLF